MGKKESELMSKNAYAKYLGISEKAVRNAINEGKIKKGFDVDNGKIIKHLADKEYGFLHQQVKVGPGVSKAKVADKLSPKKVPDKLAKPRTKGGNSSDENVQVRMSEAVKDISATDREKALIDLSQLNTDDLLGLLSITADMSYADALTANTIIEAALKKKKLEELEDILVRKANVESTLFAFGSQLRKALLAIPARVIDDIMSAGNKIEALNVLTEELVNTLDQYSNIESIKLSNKN